MKISYPQLIQTNINDLHVQLFSFLQIPPLFFSIQLNALSV